MISFKFLKQNSLLILAALWIQKKNPGFIPGFFQLKKAFSNPERRIEKAFLHFALL